MLTTIQIKELIRQGREIEFYNERYWRKYSKSIIKEQHNECYYCRKRGKYRAAECVHHVKHLRDYPELAYQRYYTDTQGRQQLQLVACCHDCHDEQHGRFKTQSKKFRNVERW